jgi:hypothetical protein
MNLPRLIETIELAFDYSTEFEELERTLLSVDD